MAYAVNILDSAAEDIVNRVAYVRQEWGNAIADQSFQDLMAKLELLASKPKMGRVVQQLADLGIRNYRILVHDSHTKILYELDESQQAIFVHMIYSSTQNFQALLYNRIIRYL